MAQGDGFAGELGHAALQQHPESRSLLAADSPVAQRLHDTGFGDLLSGARQSRVLAALLRERELERLHHLPEIMLDRPGSFGRNQRNALPESRFGDSRIAELGCVLDERFQFIRVFASLDERQDLLLDVFLVGNLVFRTVLVWTLPLVGRHDDPFAGPSCWPGWLSRIKIGNRRPESVPVEISAAGSSTPSGSRQSSAHTGGPRG